MKADPDKCIACKRCFPYCPMGRIQTFRRHDEIPGRVYIEIDQDKCTDCGLCMRASICPVNALFQKQETWPREVRGILSNPLIEFKGSQVPGRGTEEMKTKRTYLRNRYRREKKRLEDRLDTIKQTMASAQNDLDRAEYEVKKAYEGITVPVDVATMKIEKKELQMVMGGFLPANKSLVSFTNGFVYKIGIDDKGNATLQFGDGIRGAQPPSGSDNISAVYGTGGSKD